MPPGTITGRSSEADCRDLAFIERPRRGAAPCHRTGTEEAAEAPATDNSTARRHTSAAPTTGPTYSARGPGAIPVESGWDVSTPLLLLLFPQRPAPFFSTAFSNLVGTAGSAAGTSVEEQAMASNNGFAVAHQGNGRRRGAATNQGNAPGDDDTSDAGNDCPQAGGQCASAAPLHAWASPQGGLSAPLLLVTPTASAPPLGVSLA